MMYSPDVAERFWAKVATAGPDECWLWTANAGGARGPYGIFTVNGRTRRAHRVAWELANGKPISDGLLVRHLCGNSLCQNPRHLAVGTNSDNMRDSVAHGTHYNSRRTHCPAGHPYTDENTYKRLDDGCRECRTCHRERNRERMRARRARAKAELNPVPDTGAEQ